MLDPAQFVELKASGKLPSPRGAALKVVELCQRDNVTLPEIIRVLQTDPAMVGRILKLANSSAFNRPRPSVALTPDVLLSIGIKALHQVVLAFSLVADNRSGSSPGFDFDLFWSRSVATGVATQLLGAAAKVAPAAEMFTVGLLSNIGRLALAVVYPQQYGELMTRAGGQFALKLLEEESQAFGHTYLDVSAAMMLDWGLPRLFTDAVLHHVKPDNLDMSSRAARMSLCLHLGSRLAALCFLPEIERPAEFARLTPLAGMLGIDEDDLVALGDDLLREWGQWSAVLEIATHIVRPFSELKQHSTAAEVPLEKVTILIVDDDPTVRLLLNKLLASPEHIVLAARDGQEAQELALEHHPQIVITDIMMPNCDGLELIRRLRETSLGRFVYIIVLTMLDDKDKLAEAFNLGADDFLGKPVDRTVLQARLKAGMRVVREHQLLRRDQEELQQRFLELSLANQRAQEEALTDMLTGLYNRRHALERLTQEWAEADRGHKVLSVLMVDIDHFKAINDTYGHDAGDAVLRQFAVMLRSCARIADVPCRFGGEEFLIIAPDTDLTGALQLAERIRSASEQLTVSVAGLSLKLTVSIGAGTKSPSLANGDALIKVADQALYRAKQAGRNRFEAASE